MGHWVYTWICECSRFAWCRTGSNVHPVGIFSTDCSTLFCSGSDIVRFFLYGLLPCLLVCGDRLQSLFSYRMVWYLRFSSSLFCLALCSPHLGKRGYHLLMCSRFVVSRFTTLPSSWCQIRTAFFDGIFPLYSYWITERCSHQYQKKKKKKKKKIFRPVEKTSVESLTMYSVQDRKILRWIFLHDDKSNKNQKWDPLRAMKTFIRRKVGHTT